ncbi:MAG: glycoside hydrolase family 127 protein [Bacteroidales bacterium]
MKLSLVLAALTIFIYSCSDQKTDQLNTGFDDYPIEPVEFTDVNVEDKFWKPWLVLNNEVTIPASFKKCEETGRIDNFMVAGGLLEGKYRGVFPFDDSDIYKILEGASYSLANKPDPALEAFMDTVISYIEAAQESDGYLHTWRTIDPEKPPTDWSGNEHRWSDIGGGHELYNMGHFYEAAAAHFRATGKSTMLDIAVKNAALILDTFGPDKIVTAPGHQEIEIGLVKLYRVTGNREYLELARFFLDQRGNKEDRDGIYGEYSQDHIPVTEQTEAVGHAVRAGYMYTAMADIAAITGDGAYLSALEKIWDNVVGKKIYLTGGIGSRRRGESFGDNYELPNFTAYNETCAAIASIYWNYRMFLLSGDGKYMDLLERTLYNGMITGVSLSGDHFFYPNPLASDGIETFNMASCTRSEWFDCSCCPSNVTRFIPSVPGYVYATKDDQLFVNLFMGNTAKTNVAGTPVIISQTTDYPWNNKVRIALSPEKGKEFDLKIRIPGWTQNQVMASDLYHYLNEVHGEVSVYVNGEEYPYEIENGYAGIYRKWEDGDYVDLIFPMEVRIVAANELAADIRGKVAIECGPVVYCAEEMDNAMDIFSVSTIPGNTVFQKEFRKDLLGGIPVITATVPVGRENNSTTASELQLIPYHRWSNRGAGKMTVWFPAL